MNSPCGDREGPVRPNTTSVRDFCQLRLCKFPYISVRAPFGTLAGHARAPYGFRGIWKTLKIPVRGPYVAHTGIARGTRGFLRIIQPNRKYADAASRTGPVAWCDHGNSTNVKFLRALHSALRARNRTGDKNRTGPVVGCDWGIITRVNIIRMRSVVHIIFYVYLQGAMYGLE